MINFSSISKTVFVALFIWAFSPIGVFAQSLTGNYTIGPSGDYVSFTGAVNALNTNGVSGPVVFNIADGVYNEQLVIGVITGASITNTITFQSLNSDPELVQLSYEASSSAGNYVVSLEGASHLIFKDLKIKATGTTYARTVRGQLTLNNLLFQACIFESPQANSTSTDRGNVIITASTSSGIRFINNKIIGGSTGIFYQGTNGSGGTRALGFVFEQNQVLIQFYRGIQISNLFEAQVTDNRVTLLASSYVFSDGVFLDEVEGASRFTGNRIEGANQYGLYMTSCTAISGSPGLVANNHIHSKAGSYSVYFASNQYQGFYHNNVNTTGGASAFYYSGSGTAGNKVQNNIFKSN
ncbi:right-handed parallel beta-helix repeat-containing protein, partial [Algoriphagus aquimarinus]